MNISAAMNIIVNQGIDHRVQSPLSVKSVRMLNRLLILSCVNLLAYAVIMTVLGMAVNAGFCVLFFFITLVNYYLVYLKKIAAAKIMFSVLYLVMIGVFSIAFGDKLGSELWVFIISGLCLLIFRRRSNAFKMTLIGVLAFFLIVITQKFVDPLIYIEPALADQIRYINIGFIFCSLYVIAYVLRYSNEDFEQKIYHKMRLLKSKNIDLTDSINYAKRIQESLLPTELLKKYKKNFFVMYEPKDQISGDFYSIFSFNDRIVFAVFDGAGHGVPGALTSITAHTLLTQCIEQEGLKDPIDIFNYFRTLIYERKRNWKDQMMEELRLTICSYNKSDKTISYATNGNMIYLIKHVNNVAPTEDIDVSIDDRYAIKEIRDQYEFFKKPLIATEPKTGTYSFGKDDMIYLSTNGFARQMGGPKAKKFKHVRLKNLLMSVPHLNVVRQELILRDVLTNWKGKFAATDDITLVGFKV